MIFKDLEIYFLSASSNIRWGFTFATIGLITTLWYFFAFQPLYSKVTSLKNKISVCVQTEHNSEQQKLEHDRSQQDLQRRLKFAGSYNDFLKDFLAAGFQTKSIEIEKIQPYNNGKSTSVKMVLDGPFEDFYRFVKNHQKNYLCQWRAVTCSSNPDKTIKIDTHITIYSQ